MTSYDYIVIWTRYYYTFNTTLTYEWSIDYDGQTTTLLLSDSWWQRCDWQSVGTSAVNHCTLQWFCTDTI